MLSVKMHTKNMPHFGQFFMQRTRGFTHRRSHCRAICGLLSHQAATMSIAALQGAEGLTQGTRAEEMV